MRGAAIIGAMLVAPALLAAATSLVWMPDDPTALTPTPPPEPPLAAHWLGTDMPGRDMAALAMLGARLSVAVALAAAALGLGLGVPLGLARRPVRLLALLLPVLALILGIGTLGRSGLHAALAIAFLDASVAAWVTRRAARPIWRRDHIRAAELAGKSRGRIALEHVLPHIARRLAVLAPLLFGFGILAEAALSRAGLGVQPPSQSWGLMLAQDGAQGGAFVPGLAILLTGLGAALLGLGLRDRPEAGP
ncbi:MAG: ABC transporter permease subunit [Paracoccus sp. (in: a-proteobacteria)]|uniref:ABC transporter permease subunit n=1 Tax=Paracoccus sp. TaxID=267 RepID=UPI0039E5E466